MSSELKVSIGMPVHNGEAFIRQALDCLLGQTFAAFELIISDNASTDRTEEICREYASRDCRVRYIRQSSNLGAAANFQFVLDAAGAEYFMWAACDDWWSPCFVGELMNLLSSNPAAVVAFSGLHHLDMEGRVFRTYPDIVKVVASTRAAGWGGLRFNSFQRYLLLDTASGKVNIIYGLYRRSVLVASDAWRRWSAFGWGADLLIVATVLRYGEIALSPKILWKKTENPFSEGSLPRNNARSGLYASLVGAIGTYRAYLRYAGAVWTVQGAAPGVPSIHLWNRAFFTIFEFVRVTAAFAVQGASAVKRRLAVDMGG